MANQQIKVWDIAVRIFHWSLVSLFLLAYVTEDHFLDFHVIAGYMIIGLIVFRLIWGFIGTHHARFSDFIKSPAEVKGYLKSVLLLRAKRYIGHNPAGGMMVLALLASIGMVIFSGVLMYGATEFSGPLASWVGGVSDNTADIFEETHEFFANFTLLLAALHIAGVVVTSLQHRENLVRSMINGYKQAEATAPKPQPVQNKEAIQ